jgi:hypothetical protein
MRRAHLLQVPIRNPFAYLPPGNSHPPDAGPTVCSAFGLAINKTIPSQTKMQAKFFTPSQLLPTPTLESPDLFRPPPLTHPQARIA